MMRKHLWGICALATACLGTFGTASAFAPEETSATFSVQLPFSDGEFLAYGAQAADFVPPHVERQLEANLGGNWTVYAWNRQSNSPHIVYGSGVDVAPPFTDDSSVESAARFVLEQNSTALHVNPENLRLDVVQGGMGKIAAHFIQTYEGLDVIGGRAHVTFTDQGRVFVMSSDYYGIEGLDVTPTLSVAQAENIAMSDLVSFSQRNISSRPDEASKLYVLPVPTAVDQVEFRLVYRVTVETDGRTGAWITDVDAKTGQILSRQNDVHFINYLGTTQGEVQNGTYCNGSAIVPLGWMNVVINPVGTATSNPAGAWTLTNGDSTPRNAVTRFYGPWIDVNRASSGNPPDPQLTQLATPGVPLVVDWNDGNSRQDERDCFQAVSEIHDWFETIDPGYVYSNTRITCNVGVPGQCNAFWNGSINFYNTGGGCYNTGEIEGVVDHEFGHGIQNNLVGSQGNEGLGEGNGDITLNFLIDESIIGRGFNIGNCTGGIRNSDNNLQYPEGKTGAIHHDGQIIAGVVWDVREILEQNLGAAAGKHRAGLLWHFGRKIERPRFQPDQVFSMYVADDDDGNLDNGTPNWTAICEGATRHDVDQDGFPCLEVIEGVFFVHTPLTTPQPEGNAVITADIQTTVAGADIVDSSVKLHYTVNNGGAEVVVVMTPQGGNTYTAVIPGLQEADEVAYWMEAEDDAGNDGTAPLNAPNSQYEFDVPTVWDAIEVPSGWVVNLEGTDNATTGRWERGNPSGTIAQPEDDHTPPPGVNAWITGLATGGSDGGNDVDNGTTSLYSPVYDLSDSDNAKVKYYRWYSNNMGGDPNNDVWVVQVRNNGGPWIDIERNQSNQNDWVKVEADLDALLGDLGNVQFKFIASDLGTGSLVEAGVDDFAILASGATSNVPGVGASDTPKFALYGARPHPVDGPSVVAFQVPASTRVELGLFDVAGRQVRSLANGMFEAGAHDIAWDGKDSNGRELASGVYFLRMDANEFHATRTVVVTR